MALSRSIMSLMAITEADLTSEVRATGLTAGSAVRGLLASLADLLLPPVCIVCRTRIGGHGLLCGDCWARIDFIAPPICARLGVPLPYDTGEPCLSAAAIAEPPVYDRARAVARYSSTMQDLIQSFKYGDRHEGLPLFGRWLATAGAELLADADLIVPVPLYRSRLWARRFNQSALLARAVGRLTGVPVDCFLLGRVKRTPSQVGLTAAQRRRNVAGAFRVSGARAHLRGKRIVVVDDVITTGATADACARTLKRAGAARIDILALARAVEPSAFLL
jgi:ComF family protein